MWYIIASIIIGVITLILIVHTVYLSRVEKHESHLVDLYISKIGKIPAIIETMRPYVADEKVFAELIHLHRDAMIGSSASIYDILGNNLKIQREFQFLMKLSVQIPELQKKEYFLYMRDFIIKYEKNMRSYFSSVNHAIKSYNNFITLKNLTVIGYFLPGQKMSEVG